MSRNGLSKSMEYHSWNSMRQRVRTNPRYAGLDHDPRWLGADGFAIFLAEMGKRPAGTSLDRIDNRRGYFKGNCQWATPAAQTANRSTSRLIMLDGQVVTFFRAVRLMHRLLKNEQATFHITTVTLPRRQARP